MIIIIFQFCRGAVPRVRHLKCSSSLFCQLWFFVSHIPASCYPCTSSYTGLPTLNSTRSSLGPPHAQSRALAVSRHVRSWCCRKTCEARLSRHGSFARQKRVPLGTLGICRECNGTFKSTVSLQGLHRECCASEGRYTLMSGSHSTFSVG